MRGAGIEVGKMGNGLSVKMIWRTIKVELAKSPMPMGVFLCEDDVGWM